MPSKKIISLFSLASLALVIALALGSFALASNWPGDVKVSAEERDGPGPSQTEALPISLRASGFSPRKLTRPEGDYYLSINNLSDIPDLTLRLKSADQGSEREAKTSREKPYWREHVQLSPGTYVLTEASHPDWECRITVTPR